jgi:hypothetical protein
VGLNEIFLVWVSADWGLLLMLWSSWSLDGYYFVCFRIPKDWIGFGVRIDGLDTVVRCNPASYSISEDGIQLEQKIIVGVYQYKVLTILVPAYHIVPDRHDGSLQPLRILKCNVGGCGDELKINAFFIFYLPSQPDAIISNVIHVPIPDT